MVGQEILRVLAQRSFPSERIIALASERSKGMTVPYNGSSIRVEELTESAFKGIDLAKISTSFTINGTAAIIYALYLATADKAGVPRAKLRSFEGIVPKNTDWRTLNVSEEERALAPQERAAE